MTQSVQLPPNFRDDPAYTDLSNFNRWLMDGFAEFERRVKAEVEKRYATEAELLDEMVLGITIRNIACPAWLSRCRVEVEKPVPGVIEVKLDTLGPLVAPGWVMYDIVGWERKQTPEEIEQMRALREAVYGKDNQWGAD